MAKEFIGRTTEIQSEAPVIELAKLFDHSFAMLIEIDCPLTARKKVTESVFKHFLHAQWCPCHLVEEIVENKERMIATVNVFDHER